MMGIGYIDVAPHAMAQVIRLLPPKYHIKGSADMDGAVRLVLESELIDGVHVQLVVEVITDDTLILETAANAYAKAQARRG